MSDAVALAHAVSETPRWYTDTLGRRRVTLPAADRFWHHVVRGGPDDCWLWIGAKHPNGYSVLRVGSILDGSQRNVLAHRFAYALLVGPIPERLEIDHGCRTRACVNAAAHLEPVTHRENDIRGPRMAAAMARTHCPAGHPYEGDNLYLNPKGQRRCRACRREGMRRRPAA